jgi:O-antigen/teichoic acid export membrane protein
MSVSRIRINATTSAAQVVLSTVILFVIYRYLVSRIGVELVGVWSITIAISGLGRIGELGLSGAVTRYVAGDLAISHPRKAAELVQTALLSIAPLVAISLALAYPGINAVLEYVLPEATVHSARDILIYVLAYTWVSSVVGLCQAGLDGCHRLDLRNIVVVGGMLAFLGLVLLLVPIYGFVGLVYAQLLQGGLSLFASWYLLRQQLEALPIVPHQWQYGRFVELVRYGFNFQLSNLATLLCDPITKALLSKFGGPVLVGYYEMSSRMVLQVRSIVVAAIQAMVPAVAALNDSAPLKIPAFYGKAFQSVAYVSISVFCGLAILTSLVSELWLGFFSPEFLTFAMILIPGWWFNTMTVPAFFANVGTGQMVWNTLGQVMIGVLNVLLGWVLGMAFGGMGVALGYLIALLAGSTLILFQFHHRHNILLKSIARLDLAWLLLAGVAGSWLSYSTYYSLRPTVGFVGVVAVTLALFLLFIVVPAWFHPMRHILLRQFHKVAQ